MKSLISASLFTIFFIFLIVIVIMMYFKRRKKRYLKAIKKYTDKIDRIKGKTIGGACRIFGVSLRKKMVKGAAGLFFKYFNK